MTSVHWNFTNDLMIVNYPGQPLSAFLSLKKFLYQATYSLILKQTIDVDVMWRGRIMIVSICSVLSRVLNRLPVSPAGGKQYYSPESSGRCWLSSNLWRVYCSVQQSDTWGGVIVSQEAGGLTFALLSNITSVHWNVTEDLITINHPSHLLSAFLSLEKVLISGNICTDIGM